MRLVFFAGYIRNRRQLCRELALADGETEQAVLEAAYSRWGERLADHLYGGFAFVFENPESGTLFCVRDQFGLQPFFYMVTGKGELLYGSDINGLVRDPRCRRSVDPEAIQYYMCFGYPAGEKTIWKGIRKLMPGQTLTFRDGKASVSTYYQKAWTPEYECTEEEWIGRIGETLARIIREDRENVDFRSACSFLSGGVDSSYLLAVSGVSRAVGIGYRGENASETFLAAQTAKALGAGFFPRRTLRRKCFLTPFRRWFGEQGCRWRMLPRPFSGSDAKWRRGRPPYAIPAKEQTNFSPVTGSTCMLTNWRKPAVHGTMAVRV